MMLSYPKIFLRKKRKREFQNFSKSIDWAMRNSVESCPINFKLLFVAPIGYQIPTIYFEI